MAAATMHTSQQSFEPCTFTPHSTLTKLELEPLLAGWKEGCGLGCSCARPLGQAKLGSYSRVVLARVGTCVIENDNGGLNVMSRSSLDPCCREMRFTTCMSYYIC
ncbi:hypothetical protein U9M48_020060 [Paspalum notatum var. saurae]|uniref:Uncharacterized protein n=1 Tax=Paspalum notatum var. saurae TaxID=547442 RepID=A0AAQ3TE01_PASNO